MNGLWCWIEGKLLARVPTLRLMLLISCGGWGIAIVHKKVEKKK
jgi:hypothetical protein